MSTGSWGYIRPGLGLEDFPVAGLFEHIHRELKEDTSLEPNFPGSKQDGQKCGG